MTILRRYYDARPMIAGMALGIEPEESPELLVTVDTVTGEVFLGWRQNPWDAFPTLPLLRTEDDAPPADGDRVYGAEGRTYDVLNQAGEVVASVPEIEWHPAGDQDTASETFVAVPVPPTET